MENAKSKSSAKVYKFVWARSINMLIKNQRSVVDDFKPELIQTIFDNYNYCLVSAYDKKQASRMFERIIEIVERCDVDCVELLETKRISKNKMNAYMFDDGYIKKEIEFLGLKDDGD